ncbi:hypothetical protein EF294_05675 [Gordonia oryzae]|uniref:Uncharacterized protein n=1 Tax=Gordonia oryzae TaxID=2487349 RepID=A0A3N4GQY1_9ACTN|nr:hypothetical protein EF294_05675 [Gordonia oryzae]
MDMVAQLVAQGSAEWPAMRKVATEMTVNVVTDAITNAIDNRTCCGVVDLSKRVHHSDAGSQYTAIVFGQRLAEDPIAASIGTVAASFDNALAESVNSDDKNELV